MSIGKSVRLFLCSSVKTFRTRGYLGFFDPGMYLRHSDPGGYLKHSDPGWYLGIPTQGCAQGIPTQGVLRAFRPNGYLGHSDLMGGTWGIPTQGGT